MLVDVLASLLTARDLDSLGEKPTPDFPQSRNSMEEGHSLVAGTGCSMFQGPTWRRQWLPAMDRIVEMFGCVAAGCSSEQDSERPPVVVEIQQGFGGGLEKGVFTSAFSNSAFHTQVILKSLALVFNLHQVFSSSFASNL